LVSTIVAARITRASEFRCGAALAGTDLLNCAIMCYYAGGIALFRKKSVWITVSSGYV
jgi:hypothetical protein